MIILCILFISPLYFLLRKKWGAFVINAFIYLAACICVISIIGIPFAVIPWSIALIHAVYYYRSEVRTQNVELLASKMAEKMKQP